MTERPHVLLLVENAAVPHDRRVWNEARALERNGYDVTVLGPKNKKMGLIQSDEVLENVAIRRFSMPFGGPRKIDFLLEYGWAALIAHAEALRIYRRRPFQLVHVANPPDIFFGLKWMLGRLGVKFIFDQHDLSPETYQSKFDEERVDVVSRMLTWLERRTYKASDAVIVTNESYRQRAVGRGGKADSDVFTVRNSPDRSLFKPRAPKPDLKDGFKHMVVFVGTMGYQDGVHVLLDAARYVRQERERSEILFVVMGTGDSYEALQQQHAELNLGEGVRFTGFIPDDDMLDYLATADVGAAPDLESPLNDISTMIKTMDYMAMGLPVVSFDLTESRVSAGDAAVYAKAHTAEAFGDAIIELVDDPDRRDRMAQIGRERIDGPLSWDHSTRNLLDAYRKALGEQ
ncbi:MAG: glycosyltransferase family 4 protein [Acidimicrobiales bacterium]